jgi:hypothetical protein
MDAPTSLGYPAVMTCRSPSEADIDMHIALVAEILRKYLSQPAIDGTRRGCISSTSVTWEWTRAKNESRAVPNSFK